jgi:hypothetical protein
VDKTHLPPATARGRSTETRCPATETRNSNRWPMNRDALHAAGKLQQQPLADELRRQTETTTLIFITKA